MDKENSLTINGGGTSQAVAISSTSAQSAAMNSPVALVYATVDCFARRGSNPTALSDGTDQFIPANTLLRISGIERGDKLAFKTTSASGTVYITPGA